MRDADTVLRTVRAQTAVVRTLVAEMQREAVAHDDAEALHTQAVEESARLVSAVKDLSQTRAVGGSADWRGEASPLSGRRPRVLVVEDDESARDAIVRGLAPKYDVGTAGNGLEGLRAAAELSFDAIVADVWMPGMDGLTMVERIRRIQAPAVLPVVFLTGETAPERVAAGFSAGATSYLIKPVELDLLDRELRWAIAGVSD